MDSIDNHAHRLGFYRNRYLDYYTGRWLSHDPLGIMPNPTMPNRYYPIGQYRDGVNIYEYVSSNPGGITDAYGLWYGFFEPSLYKSMVRGISRWFGHEARRIYAVLKEDEEERQINQNKELIERKGGQITVSRRKNSRG